MVNDVSFLQAALIGYEQQRTEIEQKITELRRQLGGRAAQAAVEAGDGARPGRRRTLSASARKRIAEAQRKRWAQFHNEQAPTAKKAAAPAKRKMSAAAKKRIADAARKRWAAFRAKKAQGSNASKVKTAGS